MLTLSDLVSKYPNFLLEIAQICYETFISYESFLHFFIDTILWEIIVWKMLRNSIAGYFFLESFKLQDSNLSLFIFLNLSG